MHSVRGVGNIGAIGRNESLFRGGSAEALLGDLGREFGQTDLRIVNLKCPLIQKKAPRATCGLNVGAPVDCAKGLRAIGIDVVRLANNHSMDHGEQGLHRTIRACQPQKSACVGAGGESP